VTERGATEERNESGVPVEARTIDVAGTTVHYREAGAGHRDEGPALVFIHGLGSGSGSWVQNMRVLGQEHWCVAPDLIGFADTPPPPGFEGYTPTVAVKYLLQVLDALGVRESVVVGWSLGGAMALHTALAEPRRFVGLVLVSAAGIERHIHWMFRLVALPYVGERMLARIVARMTGYAEGFLARKQKSIDQEFLDYHARLWDNPWHTRSFLGVLRDNGVALSGQANSMLGDRLGELRLPTLIIWGQDDPLIPVMHGRVAADLIPDAQLRVYEQCGHMAPVEYPDRFNDEVREFLSGICAN